MNVKRLTMVAALALATASCGIKPRPVTPNDGGGALITRDEIEKTGARTMWDALNRTVKYVEFRESGVGTPTRTGRRGSSSIVLIDDVPIFIDGVRVNQIQVLASLPARDIHSIRVLNGVQATTFYGTNAGDGVILIQTVEGERR